MGQIIVTLASKEIPFEYADLGVTFESPNQDIIDAVADAVLEAEGINIKEPGDESVYTVRKVEQSQNSYLFPKALAGV